MARSNLETALELTKRSTLSVSTRSTSLLARARWTPILGSWRGCSRCAVCLRTNPGQQKEYKRVTGPFTLYMIAGSGNKLPYGNFPRLLLARVCTEAVRTQQQPTQRERLRLFSSDKANVDVKCDQHPGDPNANVEELRSS